MQLVICEKPSQPQGYVLPQPLSIKSFKIMKKLLNYYATICYNMKRICSTRR